MAEARSEEDEENMRESREQVVRRQNNSSGGRSDRRKPEHRHSQGPLSSIRAAIKRTSNRSTSLSETTPRERDRDRERERDRRRPEITILSAEPLTSWFPGAGFPPPPPPSAQIWGPTLVPSVQELQPPPSYEEVIREKHQEQVIVPAASARPPSLTPAHTFSVSTTTIATQTDTGATQETPGQTQVRRQSRPPRPSHPFPDSKPSITDRALDEPPPPFPDSDSAASISTQTPPSDLHLPSPSTSSDAVQQCPRPRPRSRVNLQPIRDEVKVQTLVKLRDDGLRTLAARAKDHDQVSNPDAIGGRYLQELLEAFSSDDWGFPEQRSASQSESEDESNQEVEEDDDMATLRARIQAFEQMHDGNMEEATVEACASSKQRPEPKPRPRLPLNKPPTVAPKPKNVPSSASVLSAKDCKGLWEDGRQSTEEAEQTETPEKPEKPVIASKPVLNVEDANANAAPVPVARSSGSTPPAQPKLPPRPSIAPRTAPPRQAQERGVTVGQTTPTLPPRPAADPRTRAKTEAANGDESSSKNVKAGGPRPGVPSKPAAVTRRSSAPNLVSNAAPDSSPVPCRPAGPPRPGPAPALRKSTSVQSGPDPPLPPRPTGVKLLPLRPPPIKSLPGRPPPPSVTSNPPPSLNKSPSSPSLLSEASVPTNHSPGQRALKKGPPLPPRPKPGHPLYNSCEKQEVLIVLDDPSPAPSEHNSQSDDSSGHVPAALQSLLDLDLNLGPNLDQDQDQHQTKTALEELTETLNILPVETIELKKEPEPPTISGPRCVALCDFVAALDDELAFSRGDVISLLELIGGDADWGRGQLHGRTGLFPINFTQTLEPLPTAPPDGETGKTTATETGGSDKIESSSSSKDKDPVTEEWAVAVFDFPGQTAGDLCFQKGALIRVLEHVDAEWRRGTVEQREGLFPAAFTQTCSARPITAQSSDAKAKALFDFTPENEDELRLKVGDVLTQVEPVDEQWIVGVVGGRRGIVPKNYISLLT